MFECFCWKECSKPARWQWPTPLFALYRPLTVHPTFSSRAAAGGKKKHAAAVQDHTGTKKGGGEYMSRGREARARPE